MLLSESTMRIEEKKNYERLTFYPHDQDETTVYRNPIFRGMQGFDNTFKHRIARWIEQIKDGTPPESIDASGADTLAAAIRSYQNGGAVMDVASFHIRTPLKSQPPPDRRR